MPYIIHDHSCYVAQDSSGRFTLTENISKAQTWFKESKANNVCKEVNRRFKEFLFKVKCVSELDLTDTSLVKPVLQTSSKPTQHTNKVVHTDSAHIQTAVKSTQQTTLDYDILETSSEFCSLVRQAKEIKPNIENKIREIEMEIVDIEHAAEFYSLNASQGYKLYKLLHNARVERRNLKDTLAKIDMLLEVNVNVDDMERLKRRILGMDNRQYTPRINNELFGV